MLFSKNCKTFKTVKKICNFTFPKHARSSSALSLIRGVEDIAEIFILTTRLPFKTILI